LEREGGQVRLEVTMEMSMLRDGIWMEAGSVLLRLGLGVVLAFAIGMEREMHGRPAGVRTHMLVAIGAMLFSEVGRSFGGDPSRVAAQVVSGIGFLGAGTIMRMGGEVRGLTTAASVWATAAIAMAASAGGAFTLVAIAATILALITLAFVDNIERKIIREPRQQVLRVRATTKSCLSHVIDHMQAAGMTVRSAQVAADEHEYEFVLEVEPKKAQALSVASQVEHVMSARWSD
jgi:putative Mg2+ transporter-C (MgtC) family protein